MKIAILDDYFDTLRTLACFRKLDAHEVAVWNDHTQDLDTLTARSRYPRSTPAPPVDGA